MSTRNRKRNYLSAGAAGLTALALAGALAGCAPSGAAPSPESAAGGESGETAGGQAAPETVTVALPGSLSTLDVSQEAGILNYYVAAVTSEGLLGIDESGELVPAVAEKWEQTDDKTYVFTLRPDAKFTDGTAVSIEDVLYSIDLARDPEKSPSTSVYWPAELEVSKTGDNEITIKLAEANVAFPWTLTAAGGLWITSQKFHEAAENYGSPTDLILGTGAYEVTEFQPDSHVTFAATDTWWGGSPSVKELEIKFIPDENTRLLAQQAGESDISINVPIEQGEQWAAIPGTEVLYQPDHSYVGLTFDASVEPFDDIHVRKAVAHALDREAIVDSVLVGKGEVATAIPTPEQIGTAVGADNARELLGELTNYEFDLEAAKAELAQSKVPDGFDVELTYPNTGPQLGKAALTLAQNLEELGINLTVTEKPIEEWVSKVGTGEYGLYYMWYLSTTGDPGEIPGWLLAPGNPAQYENEEVFNLLAQSTAESDPNARVEKLLAANEIAQKDAAYAPAWWGQSATAFAEGVKPAQYTSYFFMTPWPTKIGQGAN